MEAYESYQEHFIAMQMRRPRRLRPEIIEAYRQLPRHLFVPRFSVDGEQWTEVSRDSLEEHLPILYADTTLLLYAQGDRVSTISQPSFVLLMLELLDLRPGQAIVEVGAGSGWNAGLLGILTGRQGLVHSYEIIPEMARQAKKNLSAFDLPQVKVIEGDALQGIAEGPVYDRGILTAGAWDLPLIFFEKIADGGKLLFVLKTAEHDLLLVLRKEQDHFIEEERQTCLFVPVTGAGAPKPPSEDFPHTTKLRIYRRGEAELLPSFTSQNCDYLQD